MSNKYQAKVITISTRAANGVWEDTSGPVIKNELEDIEILPNQIENGSKPKTMNNNLVSDNIISANRNNEDISLTSPTRTKSNTNMPFCPRIPNNHIVPPVGPSNQK